MSSFPEHGLDWIETSIETARILHMINDPDLKKKFIEDVKSKTSRFSTREKLLKYYENLNPETVPGYEKLTPDTLSAAMEGRSRGNGGSQAGAPHNPMSTEFLGPGSRSKLHLIPYLLQIRTNVSYNGRQSELHRPAIPATWRLEQRL